MAGSSSGVYWTPDSDVRYVLIITTLLASSYLAESLFADGVFDQVRTGCSDAWCRILCFRQNCLEKDRVRAGVRCSAIRSALKDGRMGRCPRLVIRRRTAIEIISTRLVTGGGDEPKRSIYLGTKLNKAHFSGAVQLQLPFAFLHGCRRGFCLTLLSISPLHPPYLVLTVRSTPIAHFIVRVFHLLHLRLQVAEQNHRRIKQVWGAAPPVHLPVPLLVPAGFAPTTSQDSSTRLLHHPRTSRPTIFSALGR